MVVTGGERAVAWVGWQDFAGRGQLGQLALFYQAFKPPVSRCCNRGWASFGELYSNGLFLSDCSSFLDLQPKNR